MRVYRIQARLASDDLVDYVISYYERGKLGDTHPERMAEHTSVRACFSELMYDVESLAVSEFRVEVNLHDGGNMETGVTCRACGWIGCDTPFAVTPKEINLKQEG